MHPLGCFGSSLAYEPEGAACVACPRHNECGDLVTKNRPFLLRMLSRFIDTTGEFMTMQWLTPDEARIVRAARKKKAISDAEKAVYASTVTADDLRARIADKTAMPLLDRMTKRGINPVTDDFKTIATLSQEMGCLINALRTAPRTIAELCDYVASQSSLSASRAKRVTQALVAILRACERLESDGSTISLKEETPNAPTT